MFVTKYSKTNRLQKIVEYKANEESTSYSYWNMQIRKKLGKVSTCSFCFYQVKLIEAISMQLVSK